MKVLIVDDEPLARGELRYLLEGFDEVDSISEAESIEETLEEMLSDKPDLLFLDIHLSDESGLNLAEKIQKMDKPPMIIFATAYDEHAIKAFELNAIDYVLKPFDIDRIKQAVKKAYKEHEIRNNAVKELSKDVSSVEEKVNADISKTLPIQVNDSIFVLKLEEIVAVAVEDGKTSIHTEDNVYNTTSPLSSYEKKLPSSIFLRVHRGYIINKNFIKEIQPWFNHTYQVTMENKLKVPVSRSYIKDFKNELGI